MGEVSGFWRLFDIQRVKMKLGASFHCKWTYNSTSLWKVSKAIFTCKARGCLYIMAFLLWTKDFFFFIQSKQFQSKYLFIYYNSALGLLSQMLGA